MASNLLKGFLRSKNSKTILKYYDTLIRVLGNIINHFLFEIVITQLISDTHLAARQVLCVAYQSFYVALKNSSSINNYKISKQTL